MVNYKLTYFDFRAHGECARLILHYSKVSFEDEKIIDDFLHSKIWPSLKDKFTFGQLPVLFVDGKPLAQSYAINRYLARRYGLAGKDDFEAAQIDEIADFHKDVYAELFPYLSRNLGFVEGDAAPHHQAFIDGTEKFFPTYVKLLKESGSGFFAKSGVSWVDFVIANYLLSIRINEPEVLKKYPDLEKYVDQIHALPQIKDYVDKRPLIVF